MKETMRLHPVIPMVVRTLTEPATIGGTTCRRHERGALDPDHAPARGQLPDPEAFRPERFLEEHGNRVGPAANTWIPFGGGVRRCIGAGFSLMEGVAVLREVLAAYDVTAAGDDEPQVRNITSVPRNGARIRVAAR